MPLGKEPTRTSSFCMPMELYKQWCARLPQYGDRTKVLVELIRMFVRGQIKVTLPGKTF